MHQHLAVERLHVVVGDDDAGRQAVPVERHAVDEVELERPVRLGNGVQPGGVGAQAKVQLDREVGRRAARRRLGRRLAEELPPRRAREPVLRQPARLRVVRGRAKDL